MKKSIKKILLLMAVVMTAMVCLAFSVGAATEGYYTYSVSNGEATITRVNTSISGDVIIPSTLGGYSVTSIGDVAFFGCRGLTSITIPDSVTIIGDEAFAFCFDLESITIPDSVTSIGDGAFGRCLKLMSITIPDSVTIIGDEAFVFCIKLESITIPDSVTRIGKYAFYETGYYGDDCNWDKHVLYIGNHLISRYSDSNALFNSPYSVVVRPGTKTIADEAFVDCTYLESITMPDSVTSIGSSAFSGCTGLTSIVIPDSVTSIGSSAFSGCTGLTSIVIPDSVIQIEAKLFYDCTSLTSITIPANITSIGYDAFYNTGYYNDYRNWDETKALYVGNTLVEALDSITSYSIKEGTKSIASFAFRYCKSLKSVTIPDSVTSIGSDAFFDCTGLTSITIPKSVTSIGDYAFGGCASLESITLPFVGASQGGANNTHFGYIFGASEFRYNNSCIPKSLRHVTITAPCKIIGENAFNGCKNITSITLPDSLTDIKIEAFSKTNLKYVFFNDTQEQKESITIAYDGNDILFSEVEWHYEATDHSLGEYKTVKNATCTGDGSKQRTCVSCSYSETKTIDKLGHKYSSSYTTDKKAECTKPGSKSKHCTRSGCTSKTSKKSIPALDHSYGSYAITKEATLSKNGTKTKTCSRCSDKSKATIYSPKTFKLSYTTTVYSGKSKKPSVTVKDSKGNTLKNGTDYEVTYTSNKAIGTAKAKVTFEGVYSGSKTLSFKIVLGATDKIKATQTATTVKLSWNKVAGAKGYKVYVYDKKGELQLARTTTKTSMTIDDLKKGANYKFTVKAYTTVNKKTVWSENTKSITTATLPGTPALKATAGKGKASLSWTKQSGANGYVVYMATSKKGEYSKTGTLEGVANLKMTKSKLKKGKTYYFKVRAYKTVNGKNIYSSWSSVKSVKVK